MKTPHTASPRDHLEAVGRVIYGDHYKSPPARALKVDLRTLQRWVCGASNLAWNHGAITDLYAVLVDEHAEAVRAEAEMRTALADLDDARAEMEDWRRDHNEFRPHSAIGNTVPISLMNDSSGPPPTES